MYFTDTPSLNSVEAIMKQREAFTPEEEREWIEELNGQAADGFGEGLEQKEIHSDDGDMYVSFWNDGDDYFMKTNRIFGSEWPTIRGSEITDLEGCEYMALLFWTVRVTGGHAQEEFFVGGILREYDEPEGWAKFDDFMEDI